MNVMTELRQAFRALARRPGFTAAAVLTLGLGIGSVVAIFTLVNAILLEPLPFPESDRIVEIRHHAPGINLPELNNSPGTLALYREHADWFEAVAGMNDTRRVLTGTDRPEELEFLQASPEIFAVLRTPPAMGRPFVEEDAVEGAAPVAILLHAEWEGRYGGDPEILGRTIQLDGRAVEIVGVMPRDFRLPRPGPVGMTPLPRPDFPSFGQFGTGGIARLTAEVTLDQARASTEALQTRIPELLPGEIDANSLEGFGWGVSVVPLLDEIVEDVRGTLWIVMGTVGFVLLIAFANVANLFLVRAEARQKEMAVRSALGAGRRRIAGSFLGEAGVLGVAGGLLGILVAAVGVGLLVTHGPGNVPRLHEVSMTPRVLALAGLLSLCASLFLGWIPMTRLTAGGVAGALRDGTRGSTEGKSRHHARNLLVMSQLALALMLLVGSGLMFRTFVELRGVETGVDPTGVLAVGVSLGQGTPRDEATRFHTRVAERVAGLPGVRAVGITTQVPLATGNTNGGSFRIESRPRADDELPPVAMYQAVDPGYFDVMGIPLVAGRAMTASDVGDAVARIWVSRHFAETHFPGGWEGQRVTWGESEDTSRVWAEITGVVGNTLITGLREDPLPHAYFPLYAGGDALAYPELFTARVVVKAAEGMTPTGLAPAIREIVASVDGNVPVSRVETMDEVISQAMAGESVALVLLGVAASMALFLGAVGLFGVVSYVVSQRTREIGLRMALGAEAGEVQGMVLRQGLVVAGAGVLVGLLGAAGLTRVMDSVLFGVSPTDPTTFLVAPALLLAVSALATWLPARRASRVDPMEALRSE